MNGANRPLQTRPTQRHVRDVDVAILWSNDGVNERQVHAQRRAGTIRNFGFGEEKKITNIQAVDVKLKTANRVILKNYGDQSVYCFVLYIKDVTSGE